MRCSLEAGFVGLRLKDRCRMKNYIEMSMHWILYFVVVDLSHFHTFGWKSNVNKCFQHFKTVCVADIFDQFASDGLKMHADKNGKNNSLNNSEFGLEKWQPDRSERSKSLKAQTENFCLSSNDNTDIVLTRLTHSSNKMLHSIWNVNWTVGLKAIWIVRTFIRFCRADFTLKFACAWNKSITMILSYIPVSHHLVDEWSKWAIIVRG